MKKILSIVLATTLLVSIFSVAAFAEDDSTVFSNAEEFANFQVNESTSIDQAAIAEFGLASGITRAAEVEKYTLFADKPLTLGISGEQAKTDKMQEDSTRAALPDLTISAPQAVGTSPLVPGKVYAWKYTVRNIGSAPASNVSIGLYIDQDFVGAWNVGTLNAGVIGNGEFDFGANIYGSHQVRLVVDYKNTVVESDEHNNEGSIWYRWEDQPKFIDLVAGLSIATPPAIRSPVGQPITVQFGIANYGNQDASNVQVDILLDGRTANSFNAGTIKAQTMVLGSYDVHKTIPGNYTTGINIDPSQKINDIDRSNNRLESEYVFTWPYFFYGTDAKYVGGNRWYGRPSDHAGIDVITPHDGSGEPNRDIDVINAAPGYVELAGDAGSAGWMVVITTTANPYTSDKSLTTRYLHLQEGSIPGYIYTGRTLSECGYVLGLVGNTGSSDVAHIHFDLNPRGIVSNPTVAQSLDPERFFPHIKFTHNGMTGSNATTRSSNDLCDHTFDPNEFIDISLIREVGVNNYLAWRKNIGDNLTLNGFLEHFGYSVDTFRESLEEYNIADVYQDITINIG